MSSIFIVIYCPMDDFFYVSQRGWDGVFYRGGQGGAEVRVFRFYANEGKATGHGIAELSRAQYFSYADLVGRKNLSKIPRQLVLRPDDDGTRFCARFNGVYQNDGIRIFQQRQ